MIGDIILTDTPGFVSTNKAIYAIPTQGGTRTPVWSAAAGGDMALTSDGTLIVTCQAPDYGDPRVLAAIDCDQEADCHNMAACRQSSCQQPLGVRRFLSLCLSNIKRP
jgi:hypothetical protein